MKGTTQRQTQAIFDLVRNKFGAVHAYQVYKVVWEIEKALEGRYMSVMEVTAKSPARPSRPTTQYIRYVAHKADHLALESIDDALEKLKTLGWIQEQDSVLRTTRNLEKEMYRFRNRQLRSVGKEKDADILLFVPLDPLSGDKLVGMIDGIMWPNEHKVMVSLKEM